MVTSVKPEGLNMKIKQMLSHEAEAWIKIGGVKVEGDLLH